MFKEIDKLRNLIAESKLDRVLQILREEIPAYPDQKNQLFTLSSTFNEFRRKENMGMLSQADTIKNRAQLSYALLELLNDLENSNGVSENEVVPESKQTVKTASLKKTVFISYNHHDMEIANKLKDKLTAENIQVIIDSESMQAGEDIKEFIEKCVRETGATISLISTNSLLSAWVAMESINTFYHEKTDTGKKFIACFLTDDFFNRDFTDTALDHVDGEIKKIQNLVTDRMEKNRSIRDLQNELTRYTELRNNMDEIIRRLRESLCIDMRMENFELNFKKVVQAINS
jgi:hypothetical protein